MGLRNDGFTVKVESDGFTVKVGSVLETEKLTFVTVGAVSVMTQRREFHACQLHTRPQTYIPNACVILGSCVIYHATVHSSPVELREWPSDTRNN